MEINGKVKELEDELKVLKAEIHNVLLDIREVVLDKSNPLAEEHESAFLRMDLNTTARAMAAETAAHEAGKAMETGKDEEPTDKKPQDEVDGPPPEDKKADEEAPVPPAKGKGSRKGKGGKSGAKPEEAPLDPGEIPAMFRAPAQPAPGATVLAAWVIDAMKAIGPHQLDHIFAINRLCGNLPPNVSEALVHLQELVRASDTEDPPWLDVLQDLDRLAST